MKSNKELIDELYANLTAVSKTLAEFENQNVYGIAEIRANTGQSIRYINKLEDEYCCMRCGELHGDEPTVQYYKARVHHSCFIEHFGQEKLDQIIEAEKAFKRDYNEVGRDV